MSQFLLPDVGEGLTEAEIVSWRVEVGDVVAVNDVLCEIETAKSIVELPSPYDGRVEAILVAVGQTVPVGTAIISIAESAVSLAGGLDTPPAAALDQRDAQRAVSLAGGLDTPPAAALDQRDAQRAVSPAGGLDTPPAAALDQRNAVAAGSVGGLDTPPAAALDQRGTPTLVGYGPRDPQRRRRAAHTATIASPTAPVLAKPGTRLLARQRGIDLATITPTGRRGEVTTDDLDRSTSTGRVTHTPVTGVRRAMAEAMTASAATIPQVTVWTTRDLSAAVRSSTPPLVGLAAAVAAELGNHPLLNSVWEPDRVTLRHWVGLGIAVAAERGLLVPVVKDADLLAPTELAAAIAALVATAKAGRLSPAEQSGGTFTISNVGPLGMDGGTPIIPPGQSAILCLGRITRQPWVVGPDGEERLAIRDVGTLALSFDHRHIDGAAAAAFLEAVVARWC